MMGSVHITNQCNLRCHYCYEDDKIDKDRPVFIIGNDELGERIDKLLSMGIDFIEIIGGEPLLFPHTVRDAIELIDKKAKIGISTNGTVSNQFILDMFHKYRPLVAVSCDSPDSTEQFRRGMDLDLVMRNIKVWSEITEVIVTMTVHPGNINEMVDGFKFMNSNGISGVHFGVVVEWMNDYYWNKYTENAVEILKINKKMGWKVNLTPWMDYSPFKKEIVSDKGVELLQIFHPANDDTKYGKIKSMINEIYKTLREV